MDAMWVSWGLGRMVYDFQPWGSGRMARDFKPWESGRTARDFKLWESGRTARDFKLWESGRMHATLSRRNRGGWHATLSHWDSRLAAMGIGEDGMGYCYFQSSQIPRPFLICSISYYFVIATN